MRPRKTVFKNVEIPGRIHAMQPFLSEGKLPDGTRRWWAASGPAVQLGHLPPRFHASAREAVYVVYSYDTPIGWVLETQQGLSPYTYVVPNVSYSPTTGQHQYAVLEAWAEARRNQGIRKYEQDGRRVVVRVPGNAEVYGRTIRARSGGMDGVRPGEAVGRQHGPGPDAQDMDGGYEQGLPDLDWGHHPAHP